MGRMITLVQMRRLKILSQVPPFHLLQNFSMQPWIIQHTWWKPYQSAIIHCAWVHKIHKSRSDMLYILSLHLCPMLHQTDIFADEVNEDKATWLYFQKYVSSHVNCYSSKDQCHLGRIGAPVYPRCHFSPITHTTWIDSQSKLGLSL